MWFAYEYYAKGEFMSVCIFHLQNNQPDLNKILYMEDLVLKLLNEFNFYPYRTSAV